MDAAVDQRWTGNRVLSDRNGGALQQVFQKSGFEPGAAELPIPGLPDRNANWSTSRDGRWMMYRSQGAIWAMPAFGDRKPFRYLETPFATLFSQISPDGKWISYNTAESGVFEVYVRAFTGIPATTESKIRISSGGGFVPAWSGDSSELFYIGANSKLYAAQIASAARNPSTFEPTELFSTCAGHYQTGLATQGREYDAAPDGKRFLFACRGAEVGTYSVAVNWMSAQ